MSWFSELTSRAEAILVKLDQDAAQALHKPDGLLGGTKILDQAISSINAFRNDVSEVTESSSNEDINRLIDDDSFASNTSGKIIAVGGNDANQIGQRRSLLPSSSLSTIVEQQETNIAKPQEHSLNNQTDVEHAQNAEIVTLSQAANIILSQEPQMKQPNESQAFGRFTIQTTKNNSRAFDPNKRRDKKPQKSTTGKSVKEGRQDGSSEYEASVAGLGADDIRASINRSLHEYTIKSFSTQRLAHDDISKYELSNSATYSPESDSRLNPVQHSPSVEVDYSNEILSSRLNSSHSFSIEVPNDNQSSETSNDIAARLLRQSTLKKKSSFYLHKVINKLANSGEQADALLSDDARIKIRRVQFRMASYARRLNHYFRIYPNLKYLMLLYLLLMQVLVVYVLFFYESSSSSFESSPHIKLQQELMEPHVISEINPAVGLPS